MAASSHGSPLRERGLRISNASSGSSMSEFANSLPRSARSTSMPVGGNLGVAKAAFTDPASFLPLAACPAISRLRRSMSRQA